MKSLHNVVILILLTGASSFSHQNQGVHIQRFTGKLLKAISRLEYIAATASLALLTVVSQPANAAVDLATTYKSDDGVITFKVPESFSFSPKPLKTHEREVLFKSEMTKGLNAGVTMDPVKINNLRDFTTPAGLAKKVVDVEKAKDGVFEADVVASSETAIPVAADLPAYEIEYKIDSSRGKNHYLIKTTVANKKLYVFTVQSKEADYSSIEDTAHSIIDSFKVNDAPK